MAVDYHKEDDRSNLQSFLLSIMNALSCKHSIEIAPHMASLQIIQRQQVLYSSISHYRPDWIGDSIGYEPLLSLNNMFGRSKKKRMKKIRAPPLQVEAPERVGPYSTRIV
ncbi:hypothetical protein TNCT_529401 [Trichonephila clavata]|uniref:Uncharacterized protein n=1 Tax=Trichonephila clavata TaxID=2740835 RepID=A0A8X6FGC3_TRICU|nr:hypothetical protein TNCT_529401 [Trichonephila clavata]